MRVYSACQRVTNCRAGWLPLRASLLLTAIVLLSGCTTESSSTGNGNSGEDSPGSRQQPAVTLNLPDPDNSAASEFCFETIGAESGFDFQRFDDISKLRRILEVNGGGVAILDIDADGWPDIFMPNGCKLPISDQDQATPGRLFRNYTDFQFAECSNLASVQQFGFGTGCSVADLNEDGFDDLYVTAFGNNHCWLSNGDGTYQSVGQANGTACPAWSTSSAFCDLNSDGFLDLYVVNYLIESDQNPTLCPNSQSPDGYEGCSPAIFEAAVDCVLLSDGQGGYIDVTDSCGAGQLAGKGLGVVIADLGQDSRPEIYVANDGQANFLLEVQLDDSTAAAAVPLIKLIDRAVTANAALSASGFAQASMGIAAADFDHSGTIDLFLTHFFGDTNTLYLNSSTETDLLFHDATRSSQLGPPSRMRLGFGTTAVDFDCDGWHDLFVANGHVDDRTWMAAPQPYRMPAQLFRNSGDAVFQDVSSQAGAYFQQDMLGRGAAAGDLNRDGLVDLVVSHQSTASVILRNCTPPMATPVTLRLIGTNSPRTPRGVRVEVLADENSTEQNALSLHCDCPAGFQSADSSLLRLVCAPNQPLTVRIVWPSGLEQRVQLNPEISTNWAVMEASHEVISHYSINIR